VDGYGLPCACSHATRDALCAHLLYRTEHKLDSIGCGQKLIYVRKISTDFIRLPLTKLTNTQYICTFSPFTVKLYTIGEVYQLTS